LCYHGYQLVPDNAVYARLPTHTISLLSDTPLPPPHTTGMNPCTPPLPTPFHLQVPDTAYALDHMRPDMVLLMVLGKALVMWDNIQPTEVRAG